MIGLRFLFKVKKILYAFCRFIYVFFRTFEENHKVMSEEFTLNEPLVSYQSLDDNNVYRLIHSAKKGISYKTFEMMVKKTPFRMNEWARFLNMSERSLQRYKKEGGKFNRVVSEKIMELTMLFKLGEETFGSSENFFIWLNTTHVAMGNIKPKSLLESSFGTGLIKDELTRIAHGILA